MGRPSSRPAVRQSIIQAAIACNTNADQSRHRALARISAGAWNFKSSCPVQRLMAARTQGDEVLFQVTAELPTRLDVMDLQVRRFAAELTTPTISLQDLATQRAVVLRCEPRSPLLQESCAHCAVSTCSRNCCRCSGRSIANSRRIAKNRASVFPSCKFAPARKSAQIISRQ